MAAKTHMGISPLRSLLRSLPADDHLKMGMYVALSLASAFAGSAAAILLVPLVQPGHGLPFANLLGGAASVEARSALFALVTAGFALTRWQASRLGARLTARYNMALRCRVQARLIDAPLPSLANTTSAEIANVLTYNTEIIAQGYSALQQLLIAAVTAAVSLGFAFWVSPPLMLAAPILGAVGWLASRAFGREQTEVSRAYIADLTSLFWHSEDFPRRLRHVRSYGREGVEKDSYGAIASRLERGYTRRLELIASGRLVLELAAAVGIAAAFVVAQKWRGIDGSSLMAVCLLLGRLLPYLVSTRQSFQYLRAAAPALELWERYMALGPIDAPVDAAAGPAPGGALRIERLRVRPPAEGLDIGGLLLVPGELTLVSGDSGIGKSSLVDVLAGMGRPEIFIATADGSPIDFDGYRSIVSSGAYVSQSVRPWQRSVRECLLWAAPDATDAMLSEALADVGLDRRLARSGAGLDTSLADASSRFSGGELQRLLLAQVILRQPTLALLDEATSALDGASEMTVLAAMKRRLPRTIMVVVSHRPGVAALADQCLAIGGDRTKTSLASRPAMQVSA